MMALKSFVEIQAWQVARQLAKMVSEFTQNWHYSQHGLADQMNRAAVSVMANIAEGFDSCSDADFARFLVYSRQSATELQSHLFVARDRHLVTQTEFSSANHMADRVKSMVIAFSRYLKKEPKVGVDVGRRTSDGL